MPVTVTTSYAHDGSDHNVQVHEEGKATLISDGHLLVSTNPHSHPGAPSNVVAIYAPGQWMRAEVVKAEPKS